MIAEYLLKFATPSWPPIMFEMSVINGICKLTCNSI